MADGAQDIEAGIALAAPGLGDDLDRLLDRMVSAGLHVGVRERTAAFCLCARWLEGHQEHADAVPSDTLHDLRPLLAPLIARSRQERSLFFEVFDTFHPQTLLDETAIKADPAAPTAGWLTRNRWKVAFGVLLALALSAASLYAVLTSSPNLRPKDLDDDAGQLPAAVDTGSAAPPSQVFHERAATDPDTILGRVLGAAEAYQLAPTLEELADATFYDGPFQGEPAEQDSGAAPEEVPEWTPEAYAQRLHELTGLPLGTPLPLLGVGLVDGKSDGAIWARLAQALGRIETPGKEPRLESLEATVRAILLTADRPRTYRIADALQAKGPADHPQTLNEVVAQLAGDSTIGAGPPSEIKRALGMLGRDLSRIDTLPWIAQPTQPATVPPPIWLAWVVGGVPIFIGLWFASALAIRKPYLRRRKPHAPPLHTDIVSDAGRRAGYAAGIFQRAGQRLLTRSHRANDRLDIRATINATLRAGGELVQPVYSSTRGRPDYLVLIERAATGDHEARRMRQMVERLQALVDVDILYYQSDPAELESEDGVRRMTVEQAQSTFPEHRLVILGSGVGFMDPITFEARAPARKLLHWERRALLTPIPLAEWGREEYALAGSLDMAVGRATPEGLLQLAEYLGLEGAEAKSRLGLRGDGLARPLPALLRTRPQRFLFNAEPAATTQDELLRELRNYLDPASFDWFACLAIYPAVQWDLTLYIGVELPRIAGGKAIVSDPLYDEERLAAITQLPWMKAGRMPNWLRRALIDKLSPQRVREAKAAIEKIIEASRLKDQRADADVMLRIGREPPKEATPPERLFDDDVLLDFLNSGRREDFALPRLSRIREWFDRTFWESLGGPEGLAGIAAFAYALAAVWVSPRTGDGPVVTGAYAPLMIVALGGAAALSVWAAQKNLVSILGLAERTAPAALALLLACLVSAGAFYGLGPQLTVWMTAILGPSPADEAGLSIAQLAILAAAQFPLAMLMIVIARAICESLGVRIFAPALSSFGAWGGLLIKAALISAILAAFNLGAWPNPAVVQTAVWAGPLVGAVLAGLLAARFVPRGDSGATRPVNRKRPSILLLSARVVGLAVPLGLAGWTAISIESATTRIPTPAPDSSTFVAGPGTLSELSVGDRGLVVADQAGHLVFVASDGKPIPSIDTISAFPLASLAFTGQPQSYRALWSDKNGFVSEWRQDQPTPKALVDDRGVAVQSRGVPALLAFTPDGAPVAVVETENAVRIFWDGREAELKTDGIPPVGLAVLGNDRIAVAMLDGGVNLVRYGAGSEPVITPLNVPEDGFAPARLVTYLARTDGRPSKLRLVLVDGSVVEAEIGLADAGRLERIGHAAPLALGAPPTYARRAPGDDPSSIEDAPAVDAVPDFDRALKFVLANAGGFVDAGAGPELVTNKGITQDSYDAFLDKRRLGRKSVRDITDADIRDIYWSSFWKAARLDAMEGYPLRVIMFDAAADLGPEQSIRIFQLALAWPANKADGIVGASTLAAFRDTAGIRDQKDLLSALLDGREKHYRQLAAEDPAKDRFMRGWGNRISSLAREAGVRWQPPQSPVPPPPQPTSPTPAQTTPLVVESDSDRATASASASQIAEAAAVTAPGPVSTKPDPPPSLPVAAADAAAWANAQKLWANDLLTQARAGPPQDLQTIIAGPEAQDGVEAYDSVKYGKYPNGIRILLRPGEYKTFHVPTGPNVVIEGPPAKGKPAVFKDGNNLMGPTNVWLRDITFENGMSVFSGANATLERVMIKNDTLHLYPPSPASGKASEQTAVEGEASSAANLPSRPTRVVVLDSEISLIRHKYGNAISLSGDSELVLFNTTVTNAQSRSVLGVFYLSGSSKLTMIGGTIKTEKDFVTSATNKSQVVIKNARFEFSKAMLSSRERFNFYYVGKKIWLEENVVWAPKGYERSTVFDRLEDIFTLALRNEIKAY